jgi:uncharacterized surface protein with fasciclin (FAS1) repeats
LSAISTAKATQFGPCIQRPAAGVSHRNRRSAISPEGGQPRNQEHTLNAFPLKSRRLASVALAVALSAASFASMAQVMVGGAPMLASKNIIENAVNSKDHTTLVAAVKAAGLVDTLQGPGPFTVFAPTNAAFAALPAGTVDTLLKPENKPALTKVLTYHVVSGNMDAAALQKAVMAGGGKATLTTVSGGTLTATASGGMIMLTDENGGMAHVTIADVKQSNGVIHVVDKVLLPK